MNKPWHILRKIYVPILAKRLLRKANKGAEKFVSYYEDDLSLEVLRLRESYNVYSLTKVDKCSLFLEFLIKKNYRIDLCEEGFPNGKPFGKYLVLYNVKTDLLDYTLKLLYACGYSKDSVRVLKWDITDTSLIKLNHDEGIVALTDEKTRDYLTGIYGEDHVWNCFLERLVGKVGMQYMDVFMPVENEIIVNAGACDGKTDLQFLEWGGDKIKRIYSFESDKTNIQKCKEFIENNCDERVVLVPKGCWSENTTLFISCNAGTASSNVGTQGEDAIEVAAIDSVVRDEKVTFIKMDIEGAELKALRGAKNTIIRNRPRLAICVYHKYEDIGDVPKYILSLVPEYRFYMRHYSTVEWETVLYAYCP